MRTNKLTLSVGAALIICTLQASTRASIETIDANTLSIRSLDTAYLQDGDLIFRTGRDVVARLVLSQAERARYSHVGMLVRRNSVPYVVHAAPGENGQSGGVRIESLDRFLSPDNARDAGYFRIDELGESQRETLKNYLRMQIGKPFDYGFEYSNDDSFYCTELVLKAIALVGVDIQASLHRVHLPTLREGAIPPDSLLVSGIFRQLQQ